ncbi:Histidine kinase-like ATPase, ATP-binding domain [Pseudocohnilembus persalinus]|uniref:Histidine kinase-like ATPase, ATP-binding domain n=1 Tax=Pseudocohnilembus persalinus TaxID=266149 RepID=A0A0V0QI83_PSEPJ|nr:Histidine kinase-like ATPase, ATP-binding domain [Pseudocohnilembus persalinus]|eukprot:KRX01922.1 Histidine kinase-like ATPase, ATP-binding domain [Pseudocohnilembus persalinus]
MILITIIYSHITQIQKQQATQLLKISVEDTGTGIPEQIQQKLFINFATFEHSGKSNKAGIGLGLVNCKSMAGIIGPIKNIFLNSIPGQGSKFSFLNKRIPTLCII